MLRTGNWKPEVLEERIVDWMAGSVSWIIRGCNALLQAQTCSEWVSGRLSLNKQTSGFPKAINSLKRCSFTAPIRIMHRSFFFTQEHSKTNYVSCTNMKLHCLHEKASRKLQYFSLSRGHCHFWSTSTQIPCLFHSFVWCCKGPPSPPKP